MNKKTETYLIIGGVALIGVYLWYTNSQASAAATVAVPAGGSAGTPPPAGTTAIAPVATTAEDTTPVTPQVTDITQPGVIGMQIIAVEANSQGGAYNCLILLAITNNSDISVQLQGVAGTAQYDIIAEPYANDKMPSPLNGIIGPVADTSVVTMAPGQTATKWYKVTVPVNSATNLYLSNLAYNLAADTIKATNPNNQDAFYFFGTLTANNLQLPFKIAYIV